MFKKVLLAEDIDTISEGIMSVMNKLQITDVQHTQYCDDTYLKLKRSEMEGGEPYDLLITDLSFIPDHRKQMLESGEDLINIVKKEFPNLKILVYSIENRPEKVRHLMTDYKVNAFVSKGRRGLRELEDAILTIAKNEYYLSSDLKQTLKSKPDVEIVDSDIELLKMLSAGLSQDRISSSFKQKNIKPSSLSAIEKRLNALRIHFGANNVVHLIAIAKDVGLI